MSSHLPVPLAIGALLINAFVWGVSWWPLRQLQAMGLHPLWSTVIVYALPTLFIGLRWRASWRHLLTAPALWWLVLAAGGTNAAFNWAVSIGDVVRVILLFYLMPLWAVLLARLLLHEHLTKLAGLRVALGLAGAAIVLWPAEGAPIAGWAAPSLADGLAVIGGFCFALNNVMLKRESHRPPSARALAMFLGGGMVAGLLATVLGVQGSVPWPPAPNVQWLPIVLALGVAFLCANLALQAGAGRLRANVTSVVMLSEIVFASVSAVLLGDQVFTRALLIGGGLILGAALLAALEEHE
ncbi:DMT family transporter [Rivibacter subsaxonicus]|uniref:EamA domain-containing membrane protein RarD n=1 Tax=Rivibacter subsaxonicus TaxID=457575 RepID=A0A4Q7VXA3_9BURK|nr:DMT family transporter [Rivibacter subsaxonicus]RZU01165.1 EamA domain-containing membrane protein RarD [Rivibacter subsaxonicus]